jgi:urease accessory protein
MTPSATRDSPAAWRPGGGRFTRNRVTATASIEAVAGPGGTTRLPVLASQAPLVLRRTPEAVYLVGGAAGPLGGDSLALRIAVGPGAFLRVRTAAASIALPGPDGAESVLRVSATVAGGGRLEYLPEPVVVTDGARHATLVSVTLSAGAALVLRDEVLLGRHGEAGGTARSVLRVSYAGRPLLSQSLAVSGTDPVSLGPAVLAGHRAVGTLLRAGGAAGPSATDADDTDNTGNMDNTGNTGLAGAGGPPGDDPAGAAGRASGPLTVAVLPLAGTGVLVTALADDAVALRRRLESGQHGAV